MLAGTHKDVNKLRFPLLASEKLDGIRCLVQEGALYSRTLKLIPNVHVQTLFRGLPDGVDGELIVGSPTASDAYRKTVSLVMSDDKPLDFFGNEQVRLYCFDMYSATGFQQRMRNAIYQLEVKHKKNLNVVLVPHVIINSYHELCAFEAEMVSKGAEGVMVRDPNGPYKQGRSSENEGWLIKIKRFVDYEGEVVGTYEMEHNGNMATTNELGRTQRSSHKENKTGMGVLGGLVLRGIGGEYDGVEFGCGTGFDAATRADLWQRRDTLIGTIARVRIFPSGSKDRPRHPVWAGWRDKRDM
jgi:DNA ligase-1